MAKAKARKKAKKSTAHVDRLYMAVAHYLKKCGGSALLASGVTIIEWPGDRPGQFTVGIKVLGRKPKYADGTLRVSDGDSQP